MANFLGKPFKRLVAVIMSLAMVLSLIPAGTMVAGAEEFTVGGIEYYYNYDEEGTCEVSDYTGNAAVLTIPATVNGCTVTRISGGAFEDCTTLVSVTLPETITYIGDRAFSGCLSLNRINIPKSVTAIDYYAFSDCNSLKSVYITDMAAWCAIDFGTSGSNPLCNKARLYLNNQLVTKLAIPNGVSAIASCAFYNCVSITSVVLPNSVLSIGNSAFNSCAALTSVSLGNSLLSIGDNTFRNCTLLPHVTLPSSVISIGSETFNGCDNLASLIIPKNVASIGESGYDISGKHIFFGGTETEFLVAIGSNTRWKEADIHYNVVGNKLSTKNVPANCSEGAHTETYCSICNKSFTKTYTSGTSKHYYKFNKSETDLYTSQGIISFKCTGCSKTITVNGITNKTLKGTSIYQKSATVSGIKNKTYTGKKITQSVKVKFNGKTLKKGKDYTVTYKFNKNPGIATVTIKGKGDYVGTIIRSFEIKPKKETVKTAKSPKKKQMKVTWKKAAKVTGYQITYATNKKFTKGKKSVYVYGAKKTSCTIKKLKSKKTYYVKVRSFVSGYTDIYGKYSKVKKVKVK